MGTPVSRKRRARKSSFGSIRQQTPGRFQARYSDPLNPRRKIAKPFVTEELAKRWLVAQRPALNVGTHLDPSRRQVTFEQYACDWLRDRRLADTTRELYSGLLEQLINPTFGVAPVGRIAAADVRRWYAALASKTGARRRSQAYALLRTIMWTAVRDDKLM